MTVRNYKQSMATIKKIGYLVLILSLSVIIQFFTFFVLAQDLLLVVAIILIGFFIVYPSISFVYSKKLLSNGKHRILQSILCPITFALSYVSLLFMEDETYLYALVIFVWCELWSLLGLIKRKKGKEEKVLEK